MGVRIKELYVNRMMHEPKYILYEEVEEEENVYVYEDVITVLPEIEDKAPVFVYQPENEADEYNEIIRAGKHVCTICEGGSLCEDVRDFRPLRDKETVLKGSPLLKCAIILYSDGSERAVTCSIDTDSSECCENRIVRLSYEIDGITLECTYLLDVLPDVGKCINGHSYYRKNVWGSEECPYCAEYPEYIEILAPYEPLNVRQRESLVSAGVTLKVVYMNGREEILYGGYADNFNENYSGMQKVMVSYRGSTDTILINNIEDGKILKQPYFEGKVLSYERIVYKEEIVETLYSKGQYGLKKGDYLKLEIQTGEEMLVYGTEVRGGAD